ncbi:MAG: nicotinate-nucleotide adenylyltransferase [Coriobacteriales bacterium]
MSAAAVGKAGAHTPQERLAVLGGTFDPPHNGHLTLARGVLDALGLGRLLLMPAGDPHFKQGQQLTPARHRAAMAGLLADEDPRIELSMMEVERPGITYTADTLEQLAAANPGAQLLFVMGGDCLEHVMRWRRAEDIARLCTLVAVARPGFSFEAGRAAVESCGLPFEVEYLCLDTPDISSTQLRQRAAAGEGLEGLVPPRVAAYIAHHRLYTCC